MSNMRVAISNHADDNAQTKMSENEKGTELRQVKSAQFLWVLYIFKLSMIM